MFVRNAWYAAGWAHDLSDSPVAIKILNEPVVVFRTKDGSINALYDACPHRFAPLSLGKVKSDRIACPYHGLEFNGAGQCVHNPHLRHMANGETPATLTVKDYPTAEKYGMIWVWMGDKELASDDKLPPMPLLENDQYTWVHGQLDVKANYRMVIDNLLDLTHVEFLHPMLASEGNSQRTTIRFERNGDVVRSLYDTRDEPITGLFQILWEKEDKTADLHAYMDWHAPSNLILDVGMHTDEDDGGPKIPSLHFLTPETEDTTHYFWAAGRNRHHDNPQVAGMLQFATAQAFETEDEPMIQAARSRMHSNDLFAHKPALLPIDQAAVGVRRILDRMIKDEAQA